MNIYKYKNGNKHFHKFQDYYYDFLNRKERMEFKKVNDFRWDDNNKLMNNMDFLRWVRNNIHCDFNTFFNIILKPDPPSPPCFIVRFD